MSFRFRRSVKFSKGVRLNVSKRGDYDIPFILVEGVRVRLVCREPDYLM